MVAGIFTTSNTYSWTIPSAYAGNTIMMNVIVYDSAGWTANSVQSGTLTVSSSGSTCVPVLSNTLITFPSTKPGSYASTSNAETVTNSGTATSNIMIDGGNWISTSPAAAFWVTNTLWSATSGANIGTQLTNTITGFDTKVQVASSSSATLYFGVNIPVGQTAATYAETINVLESC
jgi:hypothetical protein